MAPQIFTLGGFARFVTEELVVNATEGRKQALEVMARAIKGKVRTVLGTYEYGWPPLREIRTQDELADETHSGH